MTLFHPKPWEIKGRRTERNAPTGRPCDSTCTHRKPTKGTSLALCSVCHELFSTVRNFDRHRSSGWCLEPTACGLRLSEAGTWREPMDLNKPNRFSAFSKGGEDLGEVDEDLV